MDDDVRGGKLSFEGWKHVPKSIYGDSIGDKMTITGGPEIKTKYSGKPAEVCPGAVPRAGTGRERVEQKHKNGRCCTERPTVRT